MKILVADDDPDVVAAMQERLRGEKREIVTASDGLRGLGVLFDGKAPSIAILDSVLPGIGDGDPHRRRWRGRAPPS